MLAATIVNQPSAEQEIIRKRIRFIKNAIIPREHSPLIHTEPGEEESNFTSLFFTDASNIQVSYSRKEINSK